MALSPLDCPSVLNQSVTLSQPEKLTTVLVCLKITVVIEVSKVQMLTTNHILMWCFLKHRHLKRCTYVNPR